MFAERLKQARKNAGYTQQKAAEALDLATRSYQRYEAVNGQCEPPLSTLVEMADLFNVSTDWLLGRDQWLKSHVTHADGY
jgi:HTH-type transcriptional regulator immR